LSNDNKTENIKQYLKKIGLIESNGNSNENVHSSNSLKTSISELKEKLSELTEGLKKK
jgi:hypothetical protein